MKKFLFGSLALAFAFVAFAFSNPEVVGKRIDYDFFYQAPSGTDFSQSAVQLKSNWTVSSISCDNTNTKACKIVVQPAYVDETVTPKVLKTTGANILSIQTATAGSSLYYVTNTTGVTTIRNQSN